MPISVYDEYGNRCIDVVGEGFGAIIIIIIIIAIMIIFGITFIQGV